jgi:anti-anti-sigma regulatory factor
LKSLVIDLPLLVGGCATPRRLDCEAITDIDVTGSHALAQTLATCRDRGVTVALSRVRQDLLATLTHYGLLERVEIYDSNEAAVAAGGADRT